MNKLFLMMQYCIIILFISTFKCTGSDLRTILQINKKITGESLIIGSVEFEIMPSFDSDNFEKNKNTIFIDKNKNRAAMKTSSYEDYQIKDEDIFLFDKISEDKKISSIPDYLISKDGKDEIKKIINTYFIKKANKFNLNIKKIIDDNALKSIDPMLLYLDDQSFSRWITFSYKNVNFSTNSFFLLLRTNDIEKYIVIECELNNTLDDVLSIKPLELNAEDFDDLGLILNPINNSNKIGFFEDQKNILNQITIKSEISARVNKNEIKSFIMKWKKINPEPHILYIQNGPKKFQKKILELLKENNIIKDKIEMKAKDEIIVATPVIKKEDPVIKKEDPVIKKEDPVIKTEDPVIKTEDPKPTVDISTGKNKKELKKIVLQEINILPTEKIPLPPTKNIRKIVGLSVLGALFLAGSAYGYLKYKRHKINLLEAKETTSKIISKLISEKRDLEEKNNLLSENINKISKEKNIKTNNIFQNFLFAFGGGAIGYFAKKN